jgi:4-oxalocrotonate tautomerase
LPGRARRPDHPASHGDSHADDQRPLRDPRPDLVPEAAALAARLAAEHLKKRPEVTAVLAEPADPAQWFVGGQSLASHGLSAVWLTIAVTAGTNIKDEAEAFVGAAFAGMAELLGPLHEVSYVVVQDVDGDRWGYGGRSQNARRAAARAG